MARKKIKNAVKTDLRYKLNRLKATTEGLELRWKIVANEIDRTRNARRIAFEGQPSTTRMVTDTNIQGKNLLVKIKEKILNSANLLYSRWGLDISSIPAFND